MGFTRDENVDGNAAVDGLIEWYCNPRISGLFSKQCISRIKLFYNMLNQLINQLLISTFTIKKCFNYFITSFFFFKIIGVFVTQLILEFRRLSVAINFQSDLPFRESMSHIRHIFPSQMGCSKMSHSFPGSLSLSWVNVDCTDIVTRIRPM